jgi:DNA-binding beta-propeller fold protein YncE
MTLVRTLVAVVVGGLALVPVAAAEIAVSANDNKVVLVNGTSTVVASPAPDTVAIIDLAASPPKLIAEIDAPASVVGPPTSVAVTPDERLALVTAAMKIDPADPKKQTPDNRVSVIDLKASPPQVIAQLEAGRGPAGVSINRQGTLALVANRAEGTVSVFTIAGTTVTSAGSVRLGDEKIGASHVAFSPDGKTALVTRDGDDRISVLSVDGTKVEHTKRDMAAGLRPYGLDISSRGDIAVVANIGRGGGQTPEGIKLSPDGRLCAVVVMNGSNKAKESPFFTDFGKLVLFRVDGTTLTKVAEEPIGHWSQGAVFSRNGQTILVGNMVEKELQVFSWDNNSLRDTGHRIKLKGGPAAIRTAE